MTILKAENISKQYRLGNVGTGTLSHDLNRFWHRVRGKEDPYLKVGAVNDRSSKTKTEYVWALRDINFEVLQGEVLGIIGKNGAGKSTLLKILSRVTSPTTGVIKTKGRIASLLEVGTGFHPELTGRENVYLNGAILGMTRSEIKSKLDEIVEFSGCELYIDTPVKRYSSGMKVRLAFAVAAHLEPDILVIDEVLAVGDAEFQKKAIGKMQDISKGEGRTVLFVSHNMAAVQSLCTRAILMENGTILKTGDVNKIIERYLKIDDGNNTSLIKYLGDTKRLGTGRIKLERVELTVQDDFTFPISGKGLRMDFYFDNPESLTNRQIRFDYRIDDQMGQRLLWLSNSLKEVEIQLAVKVISFNIDKLPLNNGRYIVTTYLRIGNETSDWIANAFSFDVAKGKFYETIQQVPSKQSKMLVDFDLKYQ